MMSDRTCPSTAVNVQHTHSPPICTGRVGRPTDVSELVAFLADERLSGYITGQHFVADGGVTKRMHYPE